MIQESIQQYESSSRKRRIAAFLIDHTLFTVILVSIVFFTNDELLNGESDLSSSLIIGFVAIIFYLAKDCFNGISPGKWIMNIMVRNIQNPTTTPSFSSLVIRNLYIIIWPVEFVVLALADDKRRLGDKAAKTIVVKNPNKVSRILRTLSLIVTAIAFVAIILVVISSAMKNSGAYKIAVQEIEQNEKIIQSVGEIKGYGFMPTGSINIVNGFGEAQLQIKVIGHERNESIYVYLTKEPEQEWKLIEMY